MAQLLPNIEFIIRQTGRISYSLDVEKVTDFPLALTYSIKDVQDPNSSKGSFSKTFSIPATKKNNTILVNLFSESIYKSFQYVEDWDALIFVDGLKVLEGKFQIKGTTYQGKPKSYECNVYGENFKWVNALSELNLCDIDFTAGNFFPHAPATATFGRDAIEETWDFNLAGEIRTIGGVQTQTHIVYPLVNTGQWNYTDSGNAIVTPSDMSPAFYFYNMIKCIFAAQGYTLDSEFFETDWFKRLISFLPKEDFINSEEVVEDYSFEYESTEQTAWKTPLHYNNTTSGTPNDCGGVIGNTFHGELSNLGVVCPTCDQQGLITTQNFSPYFNVTSPTNLTNLDSLDELTLAGWYWGCYGMGNSSPNRTTWLLDNPCGSGQRRMGHDFGCVPCDPFGGVTPLNTNNVQMNAATFQTSFLGTYIFNAEINMEMDNDYEETNPLVPNFDLPTSQGGMVQSQFTWGTGEGGSNMDCISGGSEPDGSFEDQRYGTTYVFNAYLVHYKASTGRHHLAATDSKRIYNNLNQGLSSWFCETYPLSNHSNLTAQLEFNAVALEILDPNDKVWIYTEVTCEKRDREESNYFLSDNILGLTQMKYRIKNSKFSGGIDTQLIDGGSIGLDQILPCDTTQLDWINGLTGLFNLMWESDEESKTIRVEPRGNFFNAADKAIDWTDKLDHGQDQTNEYIYDALKRNLCFTYENDSSDGFVEERNRRRGQQCELGSHALNLGELYVNEDQKIGSDFYAPTYMFYDKTISTNQGTFKQPFIPVIHSEYSAIWSANTNSQLPAKTNDYAPRILVWYGLQPLNQADGSTSNNRWRWGYDNNSNSPELKKEYPFGGVYCDQNGNLGGSVGVGAITYDNPSLYFEDSEINAVSTSPPYDISDGLYKMFWEYNILTLIDRPVILKAWFKLTQKDIATLDFRNLIHLEGKQSNTYWILNKITDYKCSANKLTQVELFEYHNTRPLKGQFQGINSGFGVNVTPVWTDNTPILVSGGVIKVPTKYIHTDLQINSPTKKPILVKGTQAMGLPQKQATFEDTNYFDDGTQVPVNANLPQSHNVGDNHNINTGSITIGKNINAQKSNQIIIGNGNNVKSPAQIQLSSNGKTSIAIKSDGIFREGGGGVVYYTDATTGEVKEVMTGIPINDPYNRSTKHYYTRVTKFDDDIEI